MATAKSIRRKRRAARSGGKQPRTTEKAVPSRKTLATGATTDSIAKKTKTSPDLDAILGRFSDALAIVETAFHALEAAEESENPVARISPGISTLRLGIRRVERVYTELDLAILRLR